MLLNYLLQYSVLTFVIKTIYENINSWRKYFITQYLKFKNQDRYGAVGTRIASPNINLDINRNIITNWHFTVVCKTHYPNPLMKPLTCISDVFWPVLCCGQSLQTSSHLHWKDHRVVQRQEASWSPSACVRHYRHCL